MAQPPRKLFGAICALAGAACWGISNPFSKRILDQGVDALDAAGLLYAGAALGLAVLLGARVLVLGKRGARIVRADWKWLLPGSLVGGAVAPYLMMYGQKHASGLAVALLIAVEPPATALIAVAMFGERITRRLVVGGLFVLTGVILVGLATTQGEGSAPTTTLGALAVASACTLWGLDSNMATRVARLDPLFVAMFKGVTAAPVVLALSALLRGAPWWHTWSTRQTVEMMGIGFVGYGLGLALMVRAFRELGAARTGALFASTSLFAAFGAIVLLGEVPTLQLGGAALLLAIGVLAIVTEKH